MNLHQKYTEVKVGKLSKDNFLREALQDERFARLITNLNTFDEAVSIFKNVGYIQEEVTTTTSKFNFKNYLKEAALKKDRFEEERHLVDRMNPYEYDKGWRHELAVIGKTDDESIIKAQKKAISNISKDTLYYTKLEMGKWAPEPDLKPIEVKDGKTEYEKRNTLQKVKEKEPTEDKNYVKAAEEKTALNEALQKATPEQFAKIIDSIQKSGMPEQEKKAKIQKVTDIYTGKVKGPTVGDVHPPSLKKFWDSLTEDQIKEKLKEAIVANLKKKPSSEQIDEAGLNKLADKALNKLSKIGQSKRDAKFKETEPADASEIVKTLKADLEKSGFPNQESPEEFVTDLTNLFTLYSNTKENLEAGAYTEEEANKIVNELRSYLDSVVKTKLAKTYRYFKEHQELNEAPVGGLTQILQKLTGTNLGASQSVSNLKDAITKAGGGSYQKGLDAVSGLFKGNGAANTEEQKQVLSKIIDKGLKSGETLGDIFSKAKGTFGSGAGANKLFTITGQGKDAVKSIVTNLQASGVKVPSMAGSADSVQSVVGDMQPLNVASDTLSNVQQSAQSIVQDSADYVSGIMGVGVGAAVVAAAVIYANKLLKKKRGENSREQEIKSLMQELKPIEGADSTENPSDTGVTQDSPKGGEQKDGTEDAPKTVSVTQADIDKDTDPNITTPIDLSTDITLTYSGGVISAGDELKKGDQTFTVKSVQNGGVTYKTPSGKTETRPVKDLQKSIDKGMYKVVKKDESPATKSSDEVKPTSVTSTKTKKVNGVEYKDTKMSKTFPGQDRYDSITTPGGIELKVGDKIGDTSSKGKVRYNEVLAITSEYVTISNPLDDTQDILVSSVVEDLDKGNYKIEGKSAKPNSSTTDTEEKDEDKEVMKLSKDQINTIKNNPLKISLTKNKQGGIKETDEDIKNKIKSYLDKYKLPYKEVKASKDGYFTIVTPKGEEDPVFFKDAKKVKEEVLIIDYLKQLVKEKSIEASLPKEKISADTEQKLKGKSAPYDPKYTDAVGIAPLVRTDTSKVYKPVYIYLSKNVLNDLKNGSDSKKKTIEAAISTVVSKIKSKTTPIMIDLSGKEDINKSSVKNVSEQDCGCDKPSINTSGCQDWSNMLPGGKGDNTLPQDVDQAELQMGIKHEMEHTNDPEIAMEIALDHLTEDPHYYSNLQAAGIDEAAKYKALKVKVKAHIMESMYDQPKPSGLLVDLEKLKHLLQNYTWPSTKIDTNYKGQDTYQDKIHDEQKMQIDNIMDRMIANGEEELAVSIYNKAAEDAGAQERYGVDTTEVKLNNAVNTVKDYVEANPNPKFK